MKKTSAPRSWSFSSVATISPVGCGSLAEAAAALETMTPDAVFSDINLPDGDGVNFCMNTAPRFPAACGC